MRRVMVRRQMRGFSGFGDAASDAVAAASGVTSTSSIDSGTDPTVAATPVVVAVTSPTVAAAVTTPGAGSMDVRLQLPVAFTFADANGVNRPWISLGAGLIASWLLYRAIKKSSL
jgi:hypothetical protein